MFEKTRSRIVASIMGILIVLWIGTLGVIYGTSYYAMVKQDREMLQTHSDMYTLTDESDDFHGAFPPEGEKNHMRDESFEDLPKLQLSTFYTVALSYDGTVLEIKNDQPNLHTDKDLEELAKAVNEQGDDFGIKNNLTYYRTDKDGYILVSFVDNTIVNENAITLMRYTLIFGGAAIVVFFFLSLLLAKKIVQPLEKSYQKQKQFISDAGHELKTPVSVVSANAELLSREIGENQWLSNIQYENERMGFLVSQLLELARTENVALRTEYVDLSRLVSGEALPFESVAFEKGLMLSCNIADGIYINGNGAQLKQTVSILLDNAIRHSKEQGTVYLTLTKEHNTARISVINNGDEIPPEHRAQIFERFYRVDYARNGEDGHYGLGLAIAKAIVDAHKGEIEARCYDGYVEFYILLPLS